MDPFNVGSIIVALVAAIAAYASQRAASRASTMNTNSTSRVDMEKDAYIRARAFDIETIASQNRELEEQKMELRELRAENRELRALLDNVKPDKGDQHERPSPGIVNKKDLSD